MPGHFDEIMIVNPISHKGGKRMRFYPVSPNAQAGYFAEAPDQMGYVYEAPETMGYYGETPESVGYVYETPEAMGCCSHCGFGYAADPPPGFVEGVGYYAEAPEMGYVYEAPEAVGYYAETPEFAGMGYVYGAPDQMGYYGQAPEVAGMGHVYEAPDQMGYYAEAPEVGYYGEAPDQMGYYGEAPDQMGYYGEAPVEGYVREQDSAARVAPVENINGVDGFYRPRTINPTCENIRPAEEQTKSSSGWFQPHW